MILRVTLKFKQYTKQNKKRNETDLRSFLGTYSQLEAKEIHQPHILNVGHMLVAMVMSGSQQTVHNLRSSLSENTHTRIIMEPMVQRRDIEETTRVLEEKTRGG